MPIRKQPTLSGGKPTKKSTSFNDPRVKTVQGIEKRTTNIPSISEMPYARSALTNSPMSKMANFMGGFGNTMVTQPVFFSPMQTPQNWQIAQKRREVYQWSRFWYENEPKVAAGIDFYAQFPMNGFTLKCKKKSIEKYFDNLVKQLKLMEWLRYMSHEYFLLGDVFPFLEIECPTCNGGGVDPDTGEECPHIDGKFKRIVCLNPDFVEVQQNPLSHEPKLFLVPSEDLQQIVFKKQQPMYSRLPPAVVQLISQKKAIPLSPKCASHVKHMASPYGIFGSSLLRRLFMTLAYKTKLMTANWIIAERLILPIRIVKVGDKERPAQAEDIADVQSHLAAVSGDPNLTIVTHNALEIDWVGAEGKIHNITAELEQVGKEILDGMMLNQSLLNGEMGAYSAAAVGVETLLQRLETWRSKLAEWVYEHIFEPTAKMQGFIDEEESDHLKGDIKYLYPTIEWEDMGIRDNSQEIQNLMQAHDKQLVSGQTICEKLKLDYDQEVERIRHETVNATQQGAPMPGGAGGGGMPGGGGGGMPGGDPAAGGMGGDPAAGGMGGDPTGGMGGGAPPGGVSPGLAPGGPTASGNLPKITKRGKAGKEPEQAPPEPMTQIQLTSLERRVLGALQQLDIPFEGMMQYTQPVKGVPQPYLLDFAYPAIKVDIEADGAFHNNEESMMHDKERDGKLAQLGWRVLRFKEDALNDHIEEVKSVIYQNIYEAAQEKMSHKKKASFDTGEGENEVFTYDLTHGDIKLGIMSQRV